MLAVAALALVAIVVLAVIGLQRIRTERTVAEQERAEARAHRADVESLLDFMLTDLRKTLAKTANLAALEGVSTRARDYFTSRDPGTSPDDLARNALALESVGRVFQDQARVDDAIAAYTRAEELAVRGLAHDPDHARAFEAAWRARTRLARVLLVRNEHARAGEIVARVDATAIPPTVTDDTADALRIGAFNAKGELAMARGDVKAARAAYTEQQAPLQRRVERAPADSSRVDELAAAHASLALIALRAWDLERGRTETDRFLETLAPALARAPDDQTLRASRATGLDRLGDVEQALGHQTEALTAFEESYAIARDLNQIDPTNVTHIRGTAIAEQKIATALLNRGDLARARERQAASMEVFLQLHARDPRNDDWARDVSIAYDRASSIEQQSGKLDDAIAFARKSEAIRKELLARHRDDPNTHRDLGISRYLIGTMSLEAKHPHEAVAALRESDASFRALIALEPKVKNHRIDRCELLGRLGAALRADGDPTGGVTVLRQAWTEMEDLVAQPEANDMWRLQHGLVAHQLAEALVALGKPAEAATVIAKVIPKLDAIVAAQPKELMFAQALASALALHATVLPSRTEAETALARAKTLIDDLAKRSPENAELQQLRKRILGMRPAR